jgi:predicted transcriptional regulator
VHHFSTTKLLERAVEAARNPPPEMLDEVARMLLQFAGVDQPVIQLAADERAAITSSIEAAERGEFATDDEVQAIWAKHGL